MDNLQEQLGLIAIIGGGQMGEAIIAGLIKNSFIAEKIIVAEPFEDRRDLILKEYGVAGVEDGSQIDFADTIIMAVKPQIFRDVALSLAGSGTFRPKRVISIAAGITTAVMAECFSGFPLIRVMPNINLSVLAGMSVVAATDKASIDETKLVCSLFGLFGQAAIIDEELVDIATSISGSGPAYFALFTEELAKGGIEAGLPEDLAWQLAVQTIIGTGRYLDLKDATAKELRDAVTSPNGTTEAAIECFESQQFGLVVQNAINACIRRAKELG
ncbi:MAG: pyrroline-5-carboxylate reductase [Coriobacteriia bacterium]|nr:pyrroline-5-carboxylate reductase [Coriobacteriia bacterium]